MLVGVETHDAKRLAEVIEKLDGERPRRQAPRDHGHVVWEVVDEKADLPMVTIENTPEFTTAPSKEDSAEEVEEKALLPNSAVTVAHGQLFVATHIDILAKVLAPSRRARNAGQ